MDNGQCLFTGTCRSYTKPDLSPYTIALETGWFDHAYLALTAIETHRQQEVLVRHLVGSGGARWSWF